MKVKKSIKKTFIITLSSLLIFGSLILPTYAEDVIEAPADELKYPMTEENYLFYGEEETLFAATKYIKRLSEAPAIASVITAKQIRDMGAESLLDILRTVPGLGITKEFVSFTSIEIRGVKTQQSEKVLLMIDGHRLNKVFLGGAFAPDYLMVDNIKRVEIIRGPGSALYGSNAFVAVINIVTKKAHNIEGIELTAGAGSFDSRRYNLMYGVEKDKIKVAGVFNYYQTDGAGLMVDEDSASALDTALGTTASIAPGHTQDQFRKYMFGLNASAGNFGFKGRYTDERKGSYVGVGYALNDESSIKYREMYGELSWFENITEDLRFNIKGYNDQFEADQYWEIFPEGFLGIYPEGYLGNPKFKHRVFGTEVQLDYYVKGHSITGGFVFEDIIQYDVFHITNFNPLTGLPLSDGFKDISEDLNFNRNAKRTVKALYLQDEWEIKKGLNLTAGVRYDNYSDFGDTVNPRAGIVWNFNKKGVVKILYGQAFRAPAFQELYNRNNPAILGNEDLKPETISTYETGLDYKLSDSVKGSVNYFYNELRDNITTTATSTIGAKYNNSGGINTHGVEMELKKKINKNSYIFTNYSFQYSKDSETGELISNVAEHRANFGANAGITKYLNVHTNLYLLGTRRRPNGDSRNYLPPVFLTDLTLILKNFYKANEIRVAIHNLFDKRYADPVAEANNLPGDLPREGIKFMLEWRYKF